MHIKIIPSKGIAIEGRKITLGNTIEQALQILGPGECLDDTYYFEKSNIAVFLEKGRIAYIELRRDDNLQVTLDALDLFHTERKELQRQLTVKNMEPPIEEDAYGCHFQNLGLCIYTEISEEDIEELIRESKADGVYEEMLEDIQKDMERAKYVETVGIFSI